jgi:hypothetical protein
VHRHHDRPIQYPFITYCSRSRVRGTQLSSPEKPGMRLAVSSAARALLVTGGH